MWRKRGCEYSPDLRLPRPFLSLETGPPRGTPRSSYFCVPITLQEEGQMVVTGPQVPHVQISASPLTLSFQRPTERQGGGGGPQPEDEQ